MRNLKFYLKKAQKEKWAVGQFNFSTLEQLKGILWACQKLKSPVILGTSEREVNFLGLKETVNLIEFYKRELKIPIFLNLDHGKDINLIKEAINLGYHSVHFDGSDLPYKENITITKMTKNYAKKKEVLVEGEIDKIITKPSEICEQKFEIREEDLTNPQLAQKFIRDTKVDGLAINIGTFHGIEISGINPKIRIDRLKEIKKRVSNVFLVLHGGSGTPENDIKKAIDFGINKININTELRLAYSNTLKEFFKNNSEEIVPYKYLPRAIKAVQKVVENKIKLFRSANKI